MKRKTPGEGLMTLTIICLVCDLGQSLVEVRIDLSSSNYASVPQNITENVTHLILSYNDITVLDNTSFIKYSKLRIIDLGYNGIEYILEGTFDNNKHLKKLHFGHCNIKYLPPSFGPSAPSIEEIDLAAAIESNFTGIIRNQYLAQFSSLTYLRLKYIKLYTIEDIFLPRSLQHLDIAHTGLSFFPNVTSDRLPALQKLTVQHNEIQEIPEYMFSGISDLLTHFTMFRNGLNCIANFALKTKLFAIDVSGNNLETQSDLLAELPKLKKIWLEKNSRWTCDKRLCWWRLWGRFRKEIRFDNPQCVNPKWMRNFTLREVNPKFMDCFNDSRFVDMFDGPYYDLVYDKRTNTGRHNSVTSGSFRKDFNYDRVLEHAAYSNSRARTRMECIGLCLSSPHCHGVIFNVTALPDEDNCVLLRQTNCGLEVCP